MRFAATLLSLTLLPALAAAQSACPAAKLEALRLPHVQAMVTRGREVLIVAIGSSSTTGWMASDVAHSYPAVLQDELNQLLPGAQVAVINRGIGGQGAAQELPRLATDALPVRPQLVIWQVGANEAVRGVDLTQFRQQLHAGIAELQQAGIDVVLMDNQRSPRVLGGGQETQVEHALQDVAEQTGAELFARGALMDQWRADGVPYAAFVASDGLHHNDRGYHCVADALAHSIVDGLVLRPARDAMQDHLAKRG
jgi:lysophospholipase L1-like esterase